MVKDSNRYFYVSAWYLQGKTIKNLGELREALEDMPEPLYWYHSKKNDFANWISKVLGNKKLATKISGADRKKAIRLLKASSKKPPRKKVVGKKPAKKKPTKKKAKKVLRKKTPMKRAVKKKPAKKKKAVKKKPKKKPKKRPAKKRPAKKKVAKRKKR